MTDREAIVARIQQAMQKANVSYGELARRTGIPKSAVHRYATGTTVSIPAERLKVICDALHIDVIWLLGWK